MPLLPVKHAIANTFTIILHVLVAVIATPRYISHASAHLYFLPDKHPEGSFKLYFGVLSSFYLLA